MEVGSKKNNNEKLTFKISKDQKREKLRIKRILVLSIKMSVKQPTNGNKIRNNNIFKKVEKITARNLSKLKNHETVRVRRLCFLAALF